MVPHRSLGFAFLPVALAIAGLACNGQVSAPDDSGSTSSRSQKGDGDGRSDEAKKAATSATPSQTNAGAAAAPACNYEYQSSSGGGDGRNAFFCQSEDHYTCNGSDATLSCSCTSTNGAWAPGECSCNGLTFAFDCNSGCAPGPAEYAKCNLPVPDDQGGWGSSSGSTGSSGFGGSSSSSSGG